MPLGGRLIGFEGKNRGVADGRLLQVFDSESEDVVGRSKFERVGPALAQSGLSFPLKKNVVGGGVERPAYQGAMVVVGDDLRLMALGLTPVVGVVGMSPCRIREPKRERGTPVLEQATRNPRHRP